MEAALPAVAGAASPATFAKVIADDAVSLADAGMVTADVTVWADNGSELPAASAGIPGRYREGHRRCGRLGH